MKIKALPKLVFDATMRGLHLDDSNVEGRKNLFLISINSSSEIQEIMEDKYQPYFKQDHPNVLRLFFDDVVADGPQNMGTITVNAKAMSVEQAKQVVDFVNGIALSNSSERHLDDLEIIVHCAAGKSRSVAVAHYIAESLGADSKQIYNREEMDPNKQVLRLLRENTL